MNKPKVEEITILRCNLMDLISYLNLLRPDIPSRCNDGAGTLLYDWWCEAGYINNDTCTMIGVPEEYDFKDNEDLKEATKVLLEEYPNFEALEWDICW